jgi:type II secretory pathway pseudopilin PulG
LDVLVSITVIAILVGIMLPSLAGVREATRKVVCSSNVRQIGLGLQMFSNDHRDELPQTVFAKNTPGASNPERMIMLRLGESQNDWDGLGLLHDRGYLPGPNVYYCPSHKGENPLAQQGARWADSFGSVLANFQYRGAYVPGQRLNISRLSPFVALVSDGLASVNDYNHQVGANVLNADLAVFWYQDNGRVRELLPRTSDDANASVAVSAAWRQIDNANPANTPTSANPPE